MTQWIYIVAFKDPSTDLVSFEHVFVESLSIGEAYRHGYERLQKAGLWKTDQAMNDYVVKLP